LRITTIFHTGEIWKGSSFFTWDEMINVICGAHAAAAHRHALDGSGVSPIMGHEVARARLSVVLR
jgi:hypothetical protein